MTAERVLVIDDEASVIRMCIRALQGAGFAAEGASGGREAIERCQKEDFALLLIDLQLPDLGGLEVLRAVKEVDPDMAAIIITDHGTLESAVEAMRLGAQEYLNKPFDGDYLVSAVQQVLDRRRQASAVVKGNLREMSLTSIVSINCNERNQACLRIRRRGREAALFFEDGQIVHMALDSQEGEEVIYELLTWEEGVFELEQGVSPPKYTVTANWSSLLLEGLHRIDEGAAGRGGMDIPEGKTVLIVEDSPVQALALEHLLARQGLRVLCAPDGQSGVTMAQQHTPDVIVLDIEMPDMNGFEVCRCLRESAQTADIPIVMLTTYREVSMVMQGISLGVIDYIPKDAFYEAVLLETLRQMHILDDV